MSDRFTLPEIIIAPSQTVTMKLPEGVHNLNGDLSFHYYTETLVGDVHPLGGPRVRVRTTVEFETIAPDEPAPAGPAARELVRKASVVGSPICACAVRSVVTQDTQHQTPYELEGCVVGVPGAIDVLGFHLEGASFQTYVLWADLREAWLRAETPDPCPHCGRSDGDVIPRGGV